MAKRTITKEDLAVALIDPKGGKVRLLKGQAIDAITALFAEITKALNDPEAGSVKIAGFGTFTLVEREERTGVNPSNPNEKIKIPASKTVKFKASKTLKDKVN